MASRIQTGDSAEGLTDYQVITLSATDQVAYLASLEKCRSTFHTDSGWYENFPLDHYLEIAKQVVTDFLRFDRNQVVVSSFMRGQRKEEVLDGVRVVSRNGDSSLAFYLDASGALALSIITTDDVGNSASIYPGWKSGNYYIPQALAKGDAIRATVLTIHNELFGDRASAP